MQALIQQMLGNVGMAPRAPRPRRLPTTDPELIAEMLDAVYTQEWVRLKVAEAKRPRPAPTGKRVFNYGLRCRLPAILDSGALLATLMGEVGATPGAIPDIARRDWFIRRSRTPGAGSPLDKWIDERPRLFDPWIKRTFGAQRPAVWCSVEQRFEPGASHYAAEYGERLDADSLPSWGGRVIRVEVDPKAAPLSWEQYCERGRVSKIGRHFWEVEQAALRADNRAWRMSLEPIPVSRWLGVELWTGQRWRELPREEW